MGKYIKRFFWISAGISVIIGIVAFIPSEKNIFKDSAAWFTLTSVLVVFGTLIENNEEKKEADFQNRFFKLHDIFLRVKDDIGANYFNKFCWDLDDDLELVQYDISSTEALTNTIEKISRIYLDLYEQEKYKLESYFQILLGLVKFVYDANISKDEKDFCIGIIIREMSLAEKKNTFYHILSKTHDCDKQLISFFHGILFFIDFNDYIGGEKLKKIFWADIIKNICTEK